MNKRQLTALSWFLIAIYAIVTIVRRSFAPNLLPAPISTALATFVPLIFLFVHGSLSYRLRDLLVFSVITLVVSNIFENMSVLTGFPFGHYYYTDLLGPKLFLVPMLIGPAYLGTAYLAWTIARVISGAVHSPLAGHLTFTVPLLAAFMMVSWDLAFDPIFATINSAWVWQDGGSYFGVPFSNFMGWLLTTFVFLQLFALYLKGQQSRLLTDEQQSREQSLQAILFYGLIAAGYVLNSVTQDTSATLTDPAGIVWRVQDIYTVTGLVAIFTMGTFTILGLVKLIDVSPAVQNAPGEVAHISAPISSSLQRITIVALAGSLYFLVIVVAVHFLRPDINPIGQLTSAYKAGPYSFLMNSALFIFGLSQAALVIGLYQAVSKPARSGLGLALLGVWAVGNLIAALFLSDLPDAPRTIPGTIAQLNGPLHVLSLVVGVFLVSRRFKQDETWRPFHRFASILSLVMLIEFITLLVLIATGSEIAGLGQRILVVTALAWGILTLARFRSIAIGRLVPGGKVAS